MFSWYTLMLVLFFWSSILLHVGSLLLIEYSSSCWFSSPPSPPSACSPFASPPSLCPIHHRLQTKRWWGAPCPWPRRCVEKPSQVPRPTLLSSQSGNQTRKNQETREHTHHRKSWRVRLTLLGQVDMARYMEKWAEKVSFAPLLLRWFADWILSIIKMVILM